MLPQRLIVGWVATAAVQPDIVGVRWGADLLLQLGGHLLVLGVVQGGRVNRDGLPVPDLVELEEDAGLHVLVAVGEEEPVGIGPAVSQVVQVEQALPVLNICKDSTVFKMWKVG